MVLGHVILEAKHASGVHLFVRVKFGHDGGFGLMVGSGVEIPEREVFHKHRAALEQRTVRIYHEATAVEHQIILTAHLIQINKRSVDLGSTALRQFKTSVGLAFLIRRAINGQQQVDVFGGEFSHRAAVLPDILANGHADSGAIHLEGHGTVSCGEDAELIEYAVVGQEVLVIAGPDHALMQHHQTVTRLTGLPIVPTVPTTTNKWPRPSS